MGEITGLTAERMLEIEAASVVSGHVTGDELFLTKHDNTEINAGNVRGPKGDTGPASLPLMAWPVGSIFMAVVPTNPNVLLGGGTWAAWGTGRFPVAFDNTQTEFDTVEETGGEKTHTLSSGEMPSHTHTQNGHNHGHTLGTAAAGVHDHALVYQSRRVDSPGGSAGAIPYSFGDLSSSGPIESAGSHTHGVTGAISTATASNQNTGGGGAHNNLPPYIVCYMWKRTA